jgi:asparagine synthase (glutamine-hydrolysing)
MCGIAGIFNIYEDTEIPGDTLKRMVAILNHRGPDGSGFYADNRIGLGHARLSIIDLEGGWQPIHNEDKSIWITFNGEIFNYKELRENLISKGHEFYTKSDTETIVHLYEDYGVDCLKYLNGQFAFALWDRDTGKLFIARDRVGIRPVFYSFAGGSIIFASEIKAIFADGRVERRIDPFALDQIFTFWTTIPPRTAFKNIFELPAAHYLIAEDGKWKVKQYWNLDFTPDGKVRSEGEYGEQLRELLIDSTRLQLRSDVPVGAYLSGGIDSSVITTLIKKYTDTPLRTFSVTFDDKVYDESAYQKEMTEHLRTHHSSIKCTYSDIGKIFPGVIWHTEKPILRTAPAPLYLLSRLVRDSGYKVVLTGEGADEILAGYDIFKETKARRFIERYPDSRLRPLILKRLYPYFENSPVRSLKYAAAFFKVDAMSYPARYYSHIPRWVTTGRTKLFFSDDLKEDLRGYRNTGELSDFLSSDFSSYDYLSQAQYIETRTLLPGYILSSQGDRVAMAHSVEGRFPFLDHRVIEFCCKLPPHIRMNALKEKYILKESMKDLLPPSVIKRTKQPYMAPDSKSFFYGDNLDYVGELLSEKYLEDTGYFDPRSVSILAKKAKQGAILGFKDNMAVVGIISTLLLHDMFVAHFETTSKEAAKRVKEDEKLAVKI